MGDRLTVGQRTLTPPVLVRIQLPQPDFINAPEASPFGKACSGSTWVSPDPNSQRDVGCEWPGRRGLQGGRGPGAPAAATGRVAGCFRLHPPALAPRVAGQAIQEQPRRGRHALLGEQGCIRTFTSRSADARSSSAGATDAPAGSFPGGFRTPAVSTGGQLTTGRHPNPFTTAVDRAGRHDIEPAPHCISRADRGMLGEMGERPA